MSVVREIIFDTETTGFDPKKGDRMVEIGCIEMVNRSATGRTFHAYFNPDRPMPAEAEAVHGLSDAFLADKPSFSVRVHELLEFIEDSPLIAHNAQFDFSFLNFELAFAGYPPVSMTRMVDTVALAKVKHPGAKLSLDALCSRYGIDRSHRTKHGALLDADLLAQVYVELLGGRQIGFELDAKPARSTVQTVVAAIRQRIFRRARPHGASASELEEHVRFMEGIPSSIWTS